MIRADAAHFFFDCFRREIVLNQLRRTQVCRAIRFTMPIKGVRIMCRRIDAVTGATR